jgi:hypothetical protein
MYLNNSGRYLMWPDKFEQNKQMIMLTQFSFSLIKSAPRLTEIGKIT